METVATNNGAEGTSLNEFRMLKYFKRKWKRFWIISLNTYRRVYTVLALTAGLPFFTCKCDEMHLRWVFTVQIAVILLKNIFEFMFNKAPKPVCSTWPRGKAFARCVEGPAFYSGKNPFLSLLSFLFFFFFSFTFHVRYMYNSFVMFLYIAYNY